MTEFTGERVIPGRVDADLWAEHLSRYRFAANLATHLKLASGNAPMVLDIGCGAGYGTGILAESAFLAVGIDVAPAATDYAGSHYRRSRLHFLCASGEALPFPDASFDAITAFEVIEHLADCGPLLAEARRVLRPGGVFLVSTPNKTYYAETRAREGPNPYHLHEFTYEEFAAALRSAFPWCAILLQNHTDAFAFYDPRGSWPIDGYFEQILGSPEDAHFFLAVCSFQARGDLRSLIHVPAATNLLREREHHVELVQAELTTAREERDAVIRMYDKQREELEAQNRWATQLDRELKQKAIDLKTVVDALDAAENTVVERTQWAQRLDAELTASNDKLRHVRASRWVRLGRKLGLGPNLDAPAADKTSIEENV